MLITGNNGFLVVAGGHCERAAVGPWTEQWVEMWRVKQAVKQTRWAEIIPQALWKRPVSSGFWFDIQENVLVTT